MYYGHSFVFLSDYLFGQLHVFERLSIGCILEQNQSQIEMSNKRRKPLLKVDNENNKKRM